MSDEDKGKAVEITKCSREASFSQGYTVKPCFMKEKKIWVLPLFGDQFLGTSAKRDISDVRPKGTEQPEGGEPLRREGKTG